MGAFAEGILMESLKEMKKNLTFYDFLLIFLVRGCS